MAIQIRRGPASDFDATKMVSGELAVSTDGTHKVWATGAAGDAWELANKEDLDTIEENLGDVEEDVADLKVAYEQIGLSVVNGLLNITYNVTEETA